MATSSSFPDVYDRTQPGDLIDQLLFKASKGLQSAELNELQALIRRRYDSVADALFNDGDRTSGADCIVLPVGNPNGTVQLTDGQIYIKGQVYPVAGTYLTFSRTAKVQVGIRFRTSDYDETADVNLRDPAIASENYGEPGAARRKVEYYWGFKADDNTQDTRAAWDFYPVHDVNAGIVVVKAPLAAGDPYVDLIARYDREALGNYVTSGLLARYINKDTDFYYVSVSAGSADIQGYKVDRRNDTKLALPINPTSLTGAPEPHTFLADGNNQCYIFTNLFPISSVIEVIGTKQKTIGPGTSTPFTHGTAGSLDTLPDNGIVQVLSVSQTVSGVTTTFVAGTDYHVTGDHIDWSPSGAEPDPGTSYNVTYQYTTDVTPDDVGSNFILVSGLVNNTTVLVHYTYVIPRVDLIAIDRTGNLQVLPGISQQRSPSAPTPNANQIALATVYYDWINDPSIANVSVRAVPFNIIQTMQRDISNLYTLMADQQLFNSANQLDPTAKLGVFVDSFVDDSKRDVGLTQTAATVDGVLMLGIPTNCVTPDGSNNLLTKTLDFTTEVIVEQPNMTDSMKINPYQAFTPIPARVTLAPRSDNWVTVNTVMLSDLTKKMIVGKFIHTGKLPSDDKLGAKNQYGGVWAQAGNTWGTQTTTTKSEVILAAENAVADQFVRVRNVQFLVSGFGPNEGLHQVLFDGIDVTPGGSPHADSSGTVTGTFTIPSNVPCGNKLVEFKGAGNSYGSASYVANGTVVTDYRQLVKTTVVRRYDPLAETFTLTEDRMISGINIKFTAVGDTSKPVYVQIRETEVGIPNQTVLAEAIIDMTSVVADGQTWTTAAFDVPLFLSGNVEYAIVVLTDDADHSVAIATLGKYVQPGYGPNVGWVTAQPYQVGVLLASSNASTWQAINQSDLAFQILGCLFSPTTKAVSLGNVPSATFSDLQVLATVQRTSSATDVSFAMTAATTGTVYTGSELQPIQGPAAVTSALAVVANLSGTSKFSPILFSGTNILQGNCNSAGTYISIALQSSTSFDIRVIFQVQKPGTSTVLPYVDVQTVDGGGADVITSGVYQSHTVALTLDSRTPVENGWYEEQWVATGLRGVGPDRHTRVDLNLAGDAGNRPKVKALRVVIR